ncbi:hypothetical protein SGGMMB4_04824 [Sodalis glossinidius str. 'morsitans']|uniref:Uncharacterized protein n=1 Tax=Sodalis glossinidius (strain morsitans) TaxID=343509 RepID=A0A193QMJ0_SODGM|nr:hypothetical protein SGGMMB4_04824 [Sodalis glossinidius str. 'morsitans']
MHSALSPRLVTGQPCPVMRISCPHFLYHAYSSVITMR